VAGFSRFWESRRAPGPAHVAGPARRRAALTLPVLWNTVDFALRGHPFALSDVVKHGELLLVSVAIVAAPLGDLPGRNVDDRARIAQTVLYVSSIVLVVLCTLAFAEVSSLVQDEKPYNEDLVASGSLFLFCCSMVTAGAGVALAEAYREAARGRGG
jgi:hypothetical protein